jgi:hypothetical protein
VKRGALGTNQYLFTETNEDGSGANIKYTVMGFNTSNQLILQDRWGSSPGDESIVSSAVFRDPSAWYHLVFVRDSDNATQADRAIMYVNGVRQAVTGSFTQSKDSSWNLQTTAAYGQEQIGRLRFAGTWYYGSDFYMTEVHSIDGQALTPSSFGETDAVTGVWKPKKYTGTYGTNGFYLNFSDNSAATATTIGKDYSGNGNNWTPNNISVTAGVTYDSMLDVPTQWADGGNGRGNYATWNPLDKNSNGTITNGNLTNTNSASNNAGIRSTFALPQSGKWYAELVVGSNTSGTVALGFGYATATADLSGSVDGANKYDIYGSSSGYIFSNTTTVTSGLGAFTSGDVLQVAYDGSTGKAWLGKNNVWYNSTGGTTGDPTNGSNQTFTLSGEFFLYSYAYNISANFNAGQRPFSYTPPTGFKALNTLNLPTPTILKGNQYMDATLYTGTGASQSITNTGSMQPDLVWVKGRSGATDHALYDSVRGVQKQLESNTTTAETTETTGLTAFNSNGFTVGALAQMNTNTATYVGWQWKANGTPAVTNTAGSITSTVSAGATQGLSVVTYTGTGANATVGHGLGVAPSMIIFKERSGGASSGVNDWGVYHVSTGNTGQMRLNLTAAFVTNSTCFNNTSPTSSVFTVGSQQNYNESGGAYVAYCFSEVAGFSKFGSYTGNGSADGPFVFCGFRPRFILRKRTDAAWRWIINDSARSDYNVSDDGLFPNYSNAEEVSITNWGVDFLSNGFKIRSTDVESNASGGTYIYAAFAENPTKFALAR